MAAPFKEFEQNVVNGIVFKRPFNCHAISLLRALNSTRKIHVLHDGYVMVSGEKVPVQRNVLAAASAYFRMLFNYSSTSEESLATVTSDCICNLDNVSRDTFEQLLDFIYTAEITLTEDNVQDILQAADMLLLGDVKEICCEYLMQHITSANCLGILELAERLSCQLVYHKAKEHLQQHFIEVCLSEEFFKLSPQRLQEILKLDALCVSSEQEVLDALLSWINYDRPSRLSFADSLVKACLHADLNHYSTDWLLRELQKNQSFVGERLLATSSYEYRIRGLEDVLMITGGINSKGQKCEILNSVQCVLLQDLKLSMTSDTRPRWIKLAPMLSPRIKHSVVEAGGFLFVLGGQDQDGTTLNTGEKYDPQKNIWISIPSMKHPRCNFGLVAVDNKLYAVGGENNKTTLVSMEEFDIYTQVWRSLPDMRLPRNNAAVAAVRRKIYVCGGSYLMKYHETVECFDIQSEIWESAPPMLERRCLAKAVGIDDILCVIGGYRPFQCHSQIAPRMLFCMNEVFFTERDCWQSFPSHINMFNSAPYTVPMDSLLVNGRNIFMIGNVYVGMANYYHYMYMLNIDHQPKEWILVLETGPLGQIQSPATFIKLPRALLEKLA